MPTLIYTRDHPCFGWRKGCEKKAEVQMETRVLCLAMCRDCAQAFKDTDGFKVKELPNA